MKFSPNSVTPHCSVLDLCGAKHDLRLANGRWIELFLFLLLTGVKIICAQLEVVTLQMKRLSCACVKRLQSHFACFESLFFSNHSTAVCVSCACIFNV